MHLITLVALVITGCIPFGATQTIDPNTVDESTKGKINDEPQVSESIC